MSAPPLALTASPVVKCGKAIARSVMLKYAASKNDFPPSVLIFKGRGNDWQGSGASKPQFEFV